MEGRVPILLINTLQERNPNVGHNVCCSVISPENMKRLVGVEHKGFYFVVQGTTVDCSRGVSVDQFGDDML